MTKCFYTYPFFDPQTREREREKKKLVKEKNKKGGDQARERHRLINTFRLFTIKNRKTCSWGHQCCFEQCAILNKQILGFKDFCEYALPIRCPSHLQAGASEKKRIKPHQKGTWLSSLQSPCLCGF